MFNNFFFISPKTLTCHTSRLCSKTFQQVTLAPESTPSCPQQSLQYLILAFTAPKFLPLHSKLLIALMVAPNPWFSTGLTLFIQNHIAALKATTGLLLTSSGWSKRSRPRLWPHGPQLQFHDSRSGPRPWQLFPGAHGYCLLLWSQNERDAPFISSIQQKSMQYRYANETQWLVQEQTDQLRSNQMLNFYNIQDLWYA